MFSGCVEPDICFPQRMDWNRINDSERKRGESDLPNKLYYGFHKPNVVQLLVLCTGSLLLTVVKQSFVFRLKIIGDSVKCIVEKVLVLTSSSFSEKVELNMKKLFKLRSLRWFVDIFLFTDSQVN